MSKIDEILLIELNAVKSELIAKHKELGMVASGNWINSLEIEINNTKGIIWGADYSRQLEYGREPTTSGGNGTLIERIEQWIKDKNITSELSVSSLAYLIARKIHRDGWKREGYGGVELISKVITHDRVQKLIDRLGIAITLEFSNILQKELAV